MLVGMLWIQSVLMLPKIHESRRALNLADHAGHFCPHAQSGATAEGWEASRIGLNDKTGTELD